MLKNSQDWSPLQKFSALFAIAYCFFHIFPFPLGHMPLMSYYDDAMEALVFWIGKHLLSIPLNRIEMTGSGDTTFDYVSALTNVILALLATCIAFIITYRRRNYATIYNWTIVYVRYYVAITMFGYGLAKLFATQFPTPSLGRLEQQFGNASPMGLLWTFMGYSKYYSVFTGMGEIIGGFLLLFRRTTVLGCIITAFIMTNVVMLNLCFDVPVKLHSAQLLLFSLLILAPNIGKLFDFFILNKPAQTYYPAVELTEKWMRIARAILKSLIIIGLPVVIFIKDIADSPRGNINHNLNGAYLTTSFVLNGDTLPPLITDQKRWSKIIIQDKSAKVTTMVDSIVYYQSKIDTINKTIQLISFQDTAKKYTFRYKNYHDYFSLAGIYHEDTISATFRKKSYNDYRLMNRGFHWINEYPYNR